MPTYSYACYACGHQFEREQRISERPIKKCPECGRAKARRQITNANFILKGGGWYADGYGPTNGKSQDKAEDSPKEAPASADSKSDTADKPAKKETSTKKPAESAATANPNS